MAQQTPAQDSAKSEDKKTESCCKDGSCPMMKKEGASADVNTAMAGEKHDCCGDSCKMMKEGATSADMATASAAMKSADMKDDCCGGSCDMANHAKDAKHDMKHASDGSCCKAKMKDTKQKDAKEKQ